MKRILLVAVLILAGGVVWAQAVDQGAPGKKGAWPVTISGSTTTGVTVVDAPCTGAVESVITFDGGGATPCPLAALAGRRTVTMCNSPKNTGTPLWTVRADGLAPTTATAAPGQTLGVGDCITYAIAATSSDGGVPTNCISNTGNVSLTITECK